MNSNSWIELFSSALERAEARAANAADLGPIACGFTNNVDLVVHLDEQMLRQLVDGMQVDVQGPRQRRGDTPGQLVTAIVQCIAAGEGIDLPVAIATTQEWLVAHVQGRPQIGGTGAQTANTLAVLGFPAVLHLTSCSPAQVDAFDRPKLIRTTSAGALVELGQAASDSDATMWHVVLEYPRGLRIELPGETVVAPAANRVIVNHDPVNSAFHIDQTFVDMVADPAIGVRRALVSGYSQQLDPECQRAFMRDTLAAVRRWRAAQPDLFAHVEVGPMPGAGDLAEVVAAVGLDMTSIGMNQDELKDVILAWGIHPGAMPRVLEAVHHRLMSTRFGLHTATYAMSITAGDPEAERDALLFATLLASARAKSGRFPTFDELRVFVKTLVPHPEGMREVDEAAATEGILTVGGDHLVVVPAPAVPSPASTIGLGDTFTAGILAMM